MTSRSLHDIQDNEVVTVNGVRGILVNKREIDSFRGPIPLSAYPINNDPNPRVTRRRLDEPLRSRQDVTVRFLKPPPPPPHGDLIIQQEKPIIPEPAPPIIIRQYQQTNRPGEPIVIREAPPKYPPPEPRKIVKILPPVLDPPPRKVIIEKFPPIYDTTQPIVIERWLAPNRPKRRVIFDGVVSMEPLRAVAAPIHNEIIEYELPQVAVNQEIRGVEVVEADPNQYYSMYRDKLVEPDKLPDFARNVRPPKGLQLASEVTTLQPILEGDLDALTKVDLEREGLTEYKVYVQKGGSGMDTGSTVSNLIISSSTGDGGNLYNNGSTMHGETPRVITISTNPRTSPTRLTSSPSSNYEIKASSTMTTGDNGSSGGIYEKRTTVYTSENTY